MYTCTYRGLCIGEKIDGVSVEQVPSAVINMNFFDRQDYTPVIVHVAY